MIRIILRGANGRMGHMIADIVKEDENVCIVAGVDIADKNDMDFPVYDSFSKINEAADVIIDFASINNFDEFLNYAVNKKIPAVICTTGFSEQQINDIFKASKSVAIFKSANMSIGINVIMKILKNVSNELKSAGFDIEIVEKHHNKKLDAPSGTALALADSINEALADKCNEIYDRTTRRQPRDKNELGISSVRGGTIVGEHEIIFAGNDEVIEIKHSAYSRAVFAKGAVEAAKYLFDKNAGMYDMSNVID